MENGQGAKIEDRLLMLTPTGKDAALTASILERAGIGAVGSNDLGEICRMFHNGVGALLIAEEAIPSSEKNPLIKWLDGQPSWSDLPILVLARSGADSAAVSMAMDRLGNVTVLERPTRIAALVSAIRSALRARRRQYQLRDEEEQLRRAHDELEDRVRERTARLGALNEVLEGQIRERQAAEDRAHALLREVVTAQEKERSRIARDLHDELGQQMTSLRLHLTAVGRKLSEVEKTRSDIGSLEQEANRIDAEISFLAWQIRPSNLEEVGLVDALRNYISEWSRNFGVPAELMATPPAPRPLLPEIEINLYRITQEALNNVAKYSKATDVAVLLSVNNDEVSMVIEDNGVGFDPETVSSASGDGGLGLDGIRERAELLAGSFEIESSPGAGTRIYTRIPARFASSLSGAPAPRNGG